MKILRGAKLPEPLVNRLRECFSSASYLILISLLLVVRRVVLVGVAVGRVHLVDGDRVLVHILLLRLAAVVEQILGMVERIRGVSISKN